MIRFIGGDCRERLKDLPDQSVQCVVTSPPYFGLRDYGTSEWTGGWDPNCDHARSVVGGPKQTRGAGQQNGHASAANKLGRRECVKCGAVRTDSQIGLEASPAAYVAEMVAVFREVWRVLRDDGTVWLNLGDSYANDAKWGGTTAGKHVGGKEGSEGYRLKRVTGFKSKDLMMIPARVAIALQDDGWYLRKDIIWAKPNPMPESVTDRPTSSHEHVFMLTKQQRYFYDAEAIKEEGTIPAGTRAAKGSAERFAEVGVNSRPPEYKVYDGTRNARDIWTIATMPYPDAHFAVMPAPLAERCILAGTSERGACPKCGAPWSRMVDRQRTRDGEPLIGSFNTGDGHKIGASGVGHWRDETRSTTTGWQPTCECPAADPIPCVVLDPFSGAGTTALVADRMGRDAIGIDLNPTYGVMARERLVKDAGMFAEFGA